MALCRPVASPCHMADCSTGLGMWSMGTYMLHVHESIMSWAPALFVIGMRGCKRLLHKLAVVLQGKNVVRLKGGCPSVFSRCGSELRALAAAGCAAELVPGVSSALAAPLFAGMPLARCLYSGYSPCWE